MRWIAGLALIAALLALGSQFARRSDAQSPLPRYQVVTSTEGTLIRLDTRTGEMVAFQILTPALWESAKKSLKQIGKLKFFEIARSPKEVQR